MIQPPRRRGVRSVETNRTTDDLADGDGRAARLASLGREAFVEADRVVQADQGCDGIRQDRGRGGEGHERVRLTREELHHAEQAPQDSKEGELTPGGILEETRTAER